MSYLVKHKKCDLQVLAEELNVKVNENAKVIELRKLILASDDYEEELAKEMLEAISKNRQEKEERERQREKEERELQREREKEEKAFQLEKLRIEAARVNAKESESNIQNWEKPSKVHFELRKLMHSYDEKEGDISLYLILFERQAQRAEINSEDWVTHLLSLLPYEITQLIAREPEEKANDYEHIKHLLLKRFKLSPERFRQKFMQHQRKLSGSWRDFGFELNNYFTEWITGLGITDFQSLKELMISEQMKRRVPNEVRDHYIDTWSKIIAVNDLTDKLDEYESVRGNKRIVQFQDHQKQNFKNKPNFSFERMSSSTQGRNEPSKFDESNASFRKNYNNRNNQAYSKYTENNTRKVNFIKPPWNENGEPKCYNCNDYGHVSKDCPKPKRIIICRKCGENGHIVKDCPVRDQAKSSSNNLSVIGQDGTEPSTYLKVARINDTADVNALIDTGSSSCLMRESAAKKLNLNLSFQANDLYGFGNQNLPAAVTIGKTFANIEIDNVVGENIAILVVKDDAQPSDLIVGRTWTDLPYIAYARIGNYLHIGYADNEPFIGMEPALTEARIKLRTPVRTTIEKNSINFIKAETDQITNGFIMIQKPEENIGSLFNVTNGETVIPVCNIGKEDVILKENQCIVRGEEVVLYTDDEHMIKSTINEKRETNEMNCKKSDDARNKCIINTSKQILTLNKYNEEKRLITPEEVKIDKDVSKEKKRELLDLLNNFRDCFALSLNELGCTDMISMEIKEIEGSSPVHMKPYRTNAEERAAIKEIIKEWKDNGIVTNTRSPYASPVMLVKKKTGEHRLVVDYRRLNKQTIKYKFPLPLIDDLLECLHGCELFCILDLAHGYLQIPLSEDAKLKTAFITPDETGQFERMIFGLTNAPSEFQRLMTQVLGSLLNKKVLCYLDDILIPAKNWEEMLDKLNEVLKCLRAANLTLKLPKCEFGKKKIEYLGFVIKSGELEPGPRKVKAIEDFPAPRNVHEVRRYLGLTSFFRRFVPKYAEKAEPLSRLTRKNEEFVWKEEQQKSFDELKNNLINQPVLSLYNSEAETEVHTDACSNGIAGMLLQKGNDNKWHLVYCVSKKTTEVEQKYHSSKLELMAIVWTLDRLRQYLIGIEFTVVTDCQALIYLNTKKTLNPQIARWCNLIQEYNFNVKHKPGKIMTHVDAISRAPVDDAEDTLNTIVENNLEVCLTLTEAEQILIIQHSDPELRKLINILQKESSERDNTEKQRTENYVLKNNRLFRVVKGKNEDRLLYVIPKSMRKSTVVKFHDLMGHFAVDRTVSKISELYWFPLMKRYVHRHISMCFECLVNKVPSGKKHGFLHPIKPGRRPFEIIHMDHLGPFVKSSRGNQELLVVIDNLTRFVRLYPVKSTATKHVMKALEDFVQDFGLPEKIISDRGTCYTSKEFEEYCDKNGITHILNSTQHPQGNGMVERTNRTILPVITTCMENPNHTDWDKKIKNCERNLNNVVNKTTDKTPFEMLHGYIPRFNDGILRKLADEDANRWNDPKILQENTIGKIEINQQKSKKYFDKKKCRSINFEAGEVVVVRRLPKHTGESTKTQPKYRGPFVVSEVLPNDTYRIMQLEEKEKGRFYSSTAHASQLKSWKCQEESDDEESKSDTEANTSEIRRSTRIAARKQQSLN